METDDELTKTFSFNFSVNTGLQNVKDNDVIYFRMNSPSQLENEYEIGLVLGEGNFGTVYSGLKKKDNSKCAIKKVCWVLRSNSNVKNIFILREQAYSMSERARLDREISILRNVKHSGIIELYAVAESPKILFIITELCMGNSLSECIQQIPKHKILEEYIVTEIIRQIASALSYLHNRSIVHRDLKPGNIMLLHKVELDYKPLNKNRDKDENESFSAKNVLKITNDLNDRTKSSSLKMNIDQLPKTFKKQSARYGLFSGSNIVHSNETKLNKIQNLTLSNRTNRKSKDEVLDNTNRDLDTLIASATPIKMHKTGLKDLPTEYKLPPFNLKIKIIDFGLAIELKKNEKVLANTCGTPLYMAPEVLNGRSYTRQCDVWSLGVLIFLLLTNQTPFGAQNEEQLIEEINKIDIKLIVQSFGYISKLGTNCLLHVLNLDPAYRYSAAELLLDPWLIPFNDNKKDESIKMSKCSLTSLINFPIDNDCNILVRSRSSVNSLKPMNFRSKSITGYRPLSVGTTHPNNKYSKTNVLELMKEYHKQLANDKSTLSEQENRR